MADKHVTMSHIFETSGFAVPHRRALLAAVQGKSSSAKNWLDIALGWWKENLKERGEGNLNAVRRLVVPFLSKSTTPDALLALNAHVALLYAGIYQDIGSEGRLKALCAFGWWTDKTGQYTRDEEYHGRHGEDSPELCEFLRACSRRQDSDPPGVPLHGVFAAALTVAVVTFAMFTCSVSWIGLPTYERAERTSESDETIPLDIIRTRGDVRGDTVFAPGESLVAMLTPQAQRFLRRIQRAVDVGRRTPESIVEEDGSKWFFGYVCGEHVWMGPNEVRYAPSSVIRLGLGDSRVQALSNPKDARATVKELVEPLGSVTARSDFVAFLVHWCAEEGPKCEQRRRSKLEPNTWDYRTVPGKATICVYVGDALLMSGKQGDTRVVLARTKHKRCTTGGDTRNETVVVHRESGPYLESELTTLIDEALLDGRVTFIVTSALKGRVEMPLNYKNRAENVDARSLFCAADIISVASDMYVRAATKKAPADAATAPV
jgi:hypothetical protein